MFGPSLGQLAFALLAVFVAAGLLVAVAARAPQLRRRPRLGAPVAGVGLAAIAGGALAHKLGGPGAIAWWWVLALLGAGLHWAEGRLGRPDDPGRSDRVVSVLQFCSGLAVLVAALSAGALLHAQQAAEALREGLGLAPLGAGAVLAGLVLAGLALAGRGKAEGAPSRVLALTSMALLAGFVALALAAALGDLGATSTGLSAMVAGAWSSEALAGGLAAAAAQACLWAALAAGPGLGGEGEGEERALVAPVGALVATLSALLVAAGEPAVAEPRPVALERHLGIGLQPSEYGQTIVIDPAAGLETDKKYEVVMRADPRGHLAGELLTGNSVAARALDTLADTDAVILRDTDPARARDPGFDIRVPCAREVIKTRAGEILKLTPLDPELDLLRLMRARDLAGPFLPMRDVHIVGSVRSGLAPQTGATRTLLYEEPRPPGAPRNPSLRDLVSIGYSGPYLDPGGASVAAPLALVGAEGFAPAPGARLALRVDAPARGLEIGFINRLDELEVPPWDFLAGTTVALLRHKDDPALDRRIPVVGRLAFGRLRFSSRDPELSFGDLSAFPDHTGPYLLPQSSRFAVEVRTGARLPPDFADRRALVPLHTQREGNPGSGLYAPHPAETLRAGMLGPFRDLTGAAQVLPALARLGPAGPVTGALLLTGLALVGVFFWVRAGARAACRVFGGGGAGLAALVLGGVLVGPLCDPALLLCVALPAVALASSLGLLALILQIPRLTR